MCLECVPCVRASWTDMNVFHAYKDVRHMYECVPCVQGCASHVRMCPMCRRMCVTCTNVSHAYKDVCHMYECVPCVQGCASHVRMCPMRACIAMIGTDVNHSTSTTIDAIKKESPSGWGVLLLCGLAQSPSLEPVHFSFSAGTGWRDENDPL